LIKFKILQLPTDEGGMTLPHFRDYFYVAHTKSLINYVIQHTKLLSVMSSCVMWFPLSRAHFWSVSCSRLVLIISSLVPGVCPSLSSLSLFSLPYLSPVFPVSGVRS